MTNHIKPHIAVVDALTEQQQSAIVQFELDGRSIGKIEIKEGVVKHATVVHIFGERALHILRRLPERVIAHVTTVDGKHLHVRSVITAAWSRTKLKAAASTS